MSNATNSEQSWQTLLTLFPRNWRELAEETGANRRLRGIPSLEALMRTLLLHLARGYSLHETVVRAKAAGVAELSAVALFKRLRNAEEWFNELCRVLLPFSGVTVRAVPEAVRLRLVDSTTVKEPGKTGSLWRLQYSFQLPEFGCDYFGLHPGEGEGTGDSFVQFPITCGDHVIGDRGYCSIAGVSISPLTVGLCWCGSIRHRCRSLRLPDGECRCYGGSPRSALPDRLANGP